MEHSTLNQCSFPSPVIVTAGANYLDIDAYACMASLAELLRLQGVEAVAWSAAEYNYSICSSLVKDGQILRKLPSVEWENDRSYIIVDVSDPKCGGGL